MPLGSFPHPCAWPPSAVCQLWPGVLGWDKSLSPCVTDIRGQQRQRGCDRSWHRCWEPRGGHLTQPEIRGKGHGTASQRWCQSLAQKDKQKPVRQRGQQRRGLPSKSTSVLKGQQLRGKQCLLPPLPYTKPVPQQLVRGIWQTRSHYL